MTVSETGRLPAAVQEAYDAAHAPGPAEPGGEAGPDWGQAGATADDAEPDETPPPAPDGGAAGAGEGPPPPADLAEARARLDGGQGDTRKPPPPGWARRGAKAKDKPARSAAPAAPARAVKALRGELEARLALLLSIPISTAAALDPVCGGAAADQLDSIVRASVPLMMQSAQIVEWFTKGATFLLWIDLAVALQPVALAVYHHHVAGDVMVFNGQIVPARRGPDGHLYPAEPVQPAPAADVSQYTTVNGHIPQPRPA
jgi:hypothetical protein